MLKKLRGKVCVFHRKLGSECDTLYRKQKVWVRGRLSPQGEVPLRFQQLCLMSTVAYIYVTFYVGHLAECKNLIHRSSVNVPNGKRFQGLKIQLHQALEHLIWFVRARQKTIHFILYFEWPDVDNKLHYGTCSIHCLCCINFTTLI